MRIFICSINGHDEFSNLRVGDLSRSITLSSEGRFRCTWIRRLGGVSAAMFSDDGKEGADGVVELEDGRVVLWSGYLGADNPEAFFKKNLVVSDDGVALREVAGGIAALALVDYKDNEVWAWCTQPSVEPIYYSSSRISNRPVGVCQGRPVFNEEYLDWYMSTGYPLDGTTPYLGVSSVESDRLVRLRPEGVTSHRHPNPPAAFSRMGLNEMAEQGASVLGSSVSVLKRFDNVELFLSSGKDSRLMAAALAYAGIPAMATTMSLSDRSVAKVVSLVSRMTGLEHRTRVVGFEFERVHSNLLATLNSSEGMLNCEANVDMLPWPTAFDSSQALIFGHSHLQKGGLLKGPIESDVHARNMLHRRFDNALASQGLRMRVRTLLDAWLGQRQFVEPGHALYWAAHDFRVTMYLRAHYHRFSAAGIPVYPLIDERFARFCGATDMDVKVNESFMFLMLSRFLPIMRDIPFVGTRWKFEINSVSPILQCGYESRAPIDPDEDRMAGESIWNSVRLINQVREVVLNGSLRDALLSRVSCEMRNAVLENNPKGFFPGAPSRRGARIQLFRMYAATVLADEILRNR